MSKFRFLFLAFTLIFLLSSCNATPHLLTNASPSSSADVKELPTEELIALRDFIGETLVYYQGQTKEVLDEMYPEQNPFPHLFSDEEWAIMRKEGEYFRALHMDSTLENFQSPQIVSGVSTGMLINEVFDVLGSPHFVADYIHAMDSTLCPKECVAYSFYVLSDGTILAIEYMPIKPEDFDALNCYERIPDFENIHVFFGGTGKSWLSWRQVSKIEVLDKEELLARSFTDRDLARMFRENTEEEGVVS